MEANAPASSVVFLASSLPTCWCTLILNASLSKHQRSVRSTTWSKCDFPTARAASTAARVEGNAPEDDAAPLSLTSPPVATVCPARSVDGDDIARIAVNKLLCLLLCLRPAILCCCCCVRSAWFGAEAARNITINLQICMYSMMYSGVCITACARALTALYKYYTEQSYAIAAEYLIRTEHHTYIARHIMRTYR